MSVLYNTYTSGPCILYLWGVSLFQCQYYTILTPVGPAYYTSGASVCSSVSIIQYLHQWALHTIPLGRQSVPVSVLYNTYTSGPCTLYLWGASLFQCQCYTILTPVGPAHCTSGASVCSSVSIIQYLHQWALHTVPLGCQSVPVSVLYNTYTSGPCILYLWGVSLFQCQYYTILTPVGPAYCTSGASVCSSVSIIQYLHQWALHTIPLGRLFQCQYYTILTPVGPAYYTSGASVCSSVSIIQYLHQWALHTVPLGCQSVPVSVLYNTYTSGPCILYLWGASLFQCQYYTILTPGGPAYYTSGASVCSSVSIIQYLHQWALHTIPLGRQSVPVSVLYNTYTSGPCILYLWGVSLFQCQYYTILTPVGPAYYTSGASVCSSVSIIQYLHQWALHTIPLGRQSVPVSVLYNTYQSVPVSVLYNTYTSGPCTLYLWGVQSVPVSVLYNTYTSGPCTLYLWGVSLFQCQYYTILTPVGPAYYTSGASVCSSVSIIQYLHQWALHTVPLGRQSVPVSVLYNTYTSGPCILYLWGVCSSVSIIQYLHQWALHTIPLGRQSVPVSVLYNTYTSGPCILYLWGASLFQCQYYTILTPVGPAYYTSGAPVCSSVSIIQYLHQWALHTIPLGRQSVPVSVLYNTYTSGPCILYLWGVSLFQCQYYTILTPVGPAYYTSGASVCSSVSIIQYLHQWALHTIPLGRQSVPVSVLYNTYTSGPCTLYLWGTSLFQCQYYTILTPVGPALVCSSVSIIQYLHQWALHTIPLGHQSVPVSVLYNTYTSGPCILYLWGVSLFQCQYYTILTPVGPAYYTSGASVCSSVSIIQYLHQWALHTIPLGRQSVPVSVLYNTYTSGPCVSLFQCQYYTILTPVGPAYYTSGASVCSSVSIIQYLHQWALHTIPLGRQSVPVSVLYNTYTSGPCILYLWGVSLFQCQYYTILTPVGPAYYTSGASVCSSVSIIQYLHQWALRQSVPVSVLYNTYTSGPCILYLWGASLFQCQYYTILTPVGPAYLHQWALHTIPLGRQSVPVSVLYNTYTSGPCVSLFQCQYYTILTPVGPASVCSSVSIIQYLHQWALRQSVPVSVLFNTYTSGPCILYLWGVSLFQCQYYTILTPVGPACYTSGASVCSSVSIIQYLHQWALRQSVPVSVLYNTYTSGPCVSLFQCQYYTILTPVGPASVCSSVSIIQYLHQWALRQSVPVSVLYNTYTSGPCVSLFQCLKVKKTFVSFRHCRMSQCVDYILGSCSTEQRTDSCTLLSGGDDSLLATD